MIAGFNTARLRWRPLREGAGAGPAAPWRQETYAHDASEPSVRVGVVWDALSELAREGGRWVASVEAPVFDHVITFAGLADRTWLDCVDFVVWDGVAVELRRGLTSDWKYAESSHVLFCGLRQTSERLVTRAAIACVRDAIEYELRTTNVSAWEKVDRLVRIVWDWTFTEEPYSDRIDDAQRALWDLVDDRPKSARDDGNGPTQAEIDAVYYAAFACDIQDRSAEGLPIDFVDHGTQAERCQKIRDAVRDDYFIALARIAQEKTT